MKSIKIGISLLTILLTASSCGGSSSPEEEVEKSEETAAPEENTPESIPVVPASEHTEPGTILGYGEAAKVPISTTNDATFLVTIQSLEKSTDEELADQEVDAAEETDYYTLRYEVVNASDEQQSTVGGPEAYSVKVSRADGGASRTPRQTTVPAGSLTEADTSVCASSSAPLFVNGAKNSKCEIWQVEAGVEVAGTWSTLDSQYVSWSN